MERLGWALPVGVPARRSVGVGRWNEAEIVHSGSGKHFYVDIGQLWDESSLEKQNKNNTTFPRSPVATDQPTREERAQNHTRGALSCCMRGPPCRMAPMPGWPSQHLKKSRSPGLPLWCFIQIGLNGLRGLRLGWTHAPSVLADAACSLPHSGG